MNFSVSSAGANVIDSIQGSMNFNLPPTVDLLTIYTRQTIIPQSGAVSFGNHWTVLVWADQPLSGPLMWVNTLACSLFPTLGDCQSASAPLLPVPYLGLNPDLANAAKMSVSVGDSIPFPPGITLPPGNWENTLILQLQGGTLPNHVQFLITEDATFQNGVMVPEPATEGEVGIGFGILFAIAYRRRRLLPERRNW